MSCLTELYRVHNFLDTAFSQLSLFASSGLAVLKSETGQNYSST